MIHVGDIMSTMGVVQYMGGFHVWSTSGGYYEYIGGYHNSCQGMDIMSTLSGEGGFVHYIELFHKYIGGYQNSSGDIMSTSGVFSTLERYCTLQEFVQYIEGIS